MMWGQPTAWPTAGVAAHKVRGSSVAWRRTAVRIILFMLIQCSVTYMCVWGWGRAPSKQGLRHCCSATFVSSCAERMVFLTLLLCNNVCSPAG